MFDTAEIVVKAGDGGDGAISFRREKFVPLGGPDGGHGGAGGNVVFEADVAFTNLLAFKQGAIYRANRGESGQGSNRHGRRGDDLVLKVPVGTIVLDKGQEVDNALVADLEHDGQRVMVARGGSGGRGNRSFASAVNQAPKLAEKGGPGEEKSLRMELRLIADVGIIGYPNVGKSTLLSAASAAKPKIANYPFTTQQPVVGVVRVGLDTFVLAEIPGLIDGAHLGKGLGHDFLRHAMRTRMYLHVVDGSSATPVEDLTRVDTELGLFDATMASKPQIVVVNKIDVPGVRERLDEVTGAFHSIGITVFPVSAATGEGVTELMTRTFEMLKQVSDTGKEVPEKVFHPVPRSARLNVRQDGDTFIVAAPALERIIARVDTSDVEVRSQLYQQMERQGINRALKNAGAVAGDRVRCGEMGWEF